MRNTCHTGRRRLLRALSAAPALTVLPGCADLLVDIAQSCPKDPADSGGVTWIPDVAHPVFWGVHDLTTADGAPRDMMVYYPAYKFQAPPVLKVCVARWPVVIFLHGQVVGGTSIVGFHRKWWRLPSTLARCGYVVAVPNHNPGVIATTADIQAAMRDIDWVRNQWSGQDWVDKRPTSTAVAGHSNGAVLAAAVAAAHPEMAALVSLSGQHTPPDDIDVLLNGVAVPSFYMWTKRNPAEDIDPYWNGFKPPKYAAVYEGEHFDYLDPADISGVPRGPCPLIGAVAADLVSLFISSNLASLTQVPIDLSKPQVQLTPQQQIYAGGNLLSLDQINSEPGCSVDLRWNVHGVIGSRHLGPP